MSDADNVESHPFHGVEIQDQDKLASWFQTQLKGVSTPFGLMDGFDITDVASHLSSPLSPETVKHYVQTNWTRVAGYKVTPSELDQGIDLYLRWLNLIQNYPLPLDTRIGLGDPRSTCVRAITFGLEAWSKHNTEWLKELLTETDWILNPAEIMIARHYKFGGDLQFRKDQEVGYEEAVQRKSVFDSINETNTQRWPQELSYYKMAATLLAPYFRPPSPYHAITSEVLQS